MTVYAPFDPASEVVDDPDFLVPLAVIRSSETIGPGGLAQVVAEAPDGVIVNAIVTPDPGRDYIIDRDGRYVQADIKIVTRFPLTTGDADTATDEVIYNGIRYRVIRVMPYLYGAGWYKAQAKATTINPRVDENTGGVSPNPPPSGGFLDR
jgi:hypothetical protein